MNITSLSEPFFAPRNNLQHGTLYEKHFRECCALQVCPSVSAERFP